MDDLAKKTVILVTHPVEFLTEVDITLVCIFYFPAMQDGQVIQSENYEFLDGWNIMQ